MQKELARRGLKTPLRLLEILEALYLASLATEEGSPIRFHVAYADPAAPNTMAANSLMHEIGGSLGLGKCKRWRCVSLSTSLALTPSIAVKLAAGTDPRSSVLLVYEFEGRVMIWGLADMQYEFTRFATHETTPDNQANRPGRFQVHIDGVGHLKVYIGFDRIAELRAGELLPSPIDVLNDGPVHAVFSKLSSLIFKHFCRPNLARLTSRDQVERTVLSTVYQLLIRAENLRHGGAFLIAAAETDASLQITNAIEYTRLLEGVAMEALSQATAAATVILNVRLFEDGKDLPVHLWTEEKKGWIRARDAEKSLDGAIWFVALLTRVDGLVLLDHSLCVRGFGVVLKETDMPEGIKAFQAVTTSPTQSTLRRLRLENFGTRHRSMAAYCARHPGSLGFVISKDGGVRVFTRVKKRLIMWDNIRLHQAPPSPETIQESENSLRKVLEDGDLLDRKRDKASSKSEVKQKSEHLKAFVEREYPKLFWRSSKKRTK